MIVNIQVRAFSSNKLQLFSYTILEDYPTSQLVLFVFVENITLCIAASKRNNIRYLQIIQFINPFSPQLAIHLVHESGVVVFSSFEIKSKVNRTLAVTC